MIGHLTGQCVELAATVNHRLPPVPGWFYSQDRCDSVPIATMLERKRLDLDSFARLVHQLQTRARLESVATATKRRGGKTAKTQSQFELSLIHI